MKMTKDLFIDLCKEGLAYLYIIKCYDDNEEFYKVGVTSKENPYERFSSIPYQCELVEFYSHISPVFIIDLERKLLSLRDKFKPSKSFGGYSECLSDINPLVEYLQSIEWITDLKPILYTKGSKRNHVRGRKSVDKMIREYKSLLELRSEAHQYQDENLIEIAEFKIEEFLQNNSEFDEWLSSGITVSNMTTLNKHRDSINELAETNRKLSGHAEAIVYELKLQIGSLYSNQELKETIQEYYDRNGIKKKAKGTDISQWYEVSKTTSKQNGKLVACLKIISKL